MLIFRTVNAQIGRNSNYPCKHVLAIFAKYERDWNHLPASYRNSPYFSVDYDFIDARKPSVQQEKLEVADSENVLSGEEWKYQKEYIQKGQRHQFVGKC